MGARPYDPSLGRFLATDPIVGGALNTYDYAGQDPINSFDLNGTDMVIRRAGLLAGLGLAIAASADYCLKSGLCIVKWIDIPQIQDEEIIRLAESDSTKVKDILPKLKGSARRQIDPRIRDNPDITLGDVRSAARTGRLPSGASIPKKTANRAKKILTDLRFRPE